MEKDKDKNQIPNPGEQKKQNDSGGPKKTEKQKKSGTLNRENIFAGISIGLFLLVLILGFEVINLKRQGLFYCANGGFSPWMPRGGYYSMFSPERGPFDEFNRMERTLARMFRENYSGGNYFYGHNGFVPNIDVQETKSEYIVKLDIPGTAKNNIDIETKDHTLFVSGQKSEDKETKGGNRFFARERSFGSFSKSVSLPEDADMNSVKAHYKRGVLTIEIQKIVLGNKKLSGNRITVQ